MPKEATLKVLNTSEHPWEGCPVKIQKNYLSTNGQGVASLRNWIGQIVEIFVHGERLYVDGKTDIKIENGTYIVVQKLRGGFLAVMKSIDSKSTHPLPSGSHPTSVHTAD